MKNDARNAFIVAVLMLVGVASCGGEGARPTREEVIAGCEELADASCRQFGECLGWTDVEIDDCVADETASCDEELEEPSCWGAQLDNYYECADETAAESCSDTCGENGFCFVYCPYFCPSS